MITAITQDMIKIAAEAQAWASGVKLKALPPEEYAGYLKAVEAGLRAAEETVCGAFYGKLPHNRPSPYGMSEEQMLHDVALKLDRFCTRNPAIVKDICVSPVFMTTVGRVIEKLQSARHEVNVLRSIVTKAPGT